jgi:type I restriction enzyme S subunit
VSQDLPAGWTLAPLTDLISVEGVFIDGDWVESKDQDPLGEVRLTQLADVGDASWLDRSDRYLTRDAAERLRCTYLEGGDVLVARMPHPLGRSCIFPGAERPCVTVVDVAIIRPGAGSVDPRWLMHTINSPAVRSAIDGMQSGTTRKRISRKNLGKIVLPIPPIAEQQRIVDELERRLSHVEAAANGLTSASKRLIAAKEAVLWSLVLPGLDRGGATDALPDLPNGWEWTVLGDVADIVGGVTKDTKREKDPSFVEVPYLRVANVQRGYLDLAEVSNIRVDPDKAKSLRLEPGDVLFNEGGDRDKLGRGWIWEGQVADCIHQNHVFRARLHEPRLEAKFVSWVGNTFGKTWFEAAGKQTTNLASVNKTALKAFPIPVPPPGIATEIVAEAERRLSLIEAAERGVDANRHKTTSLRRSLLAIAYSGQLVSQDPADEPADSLLEHIRASRVATMSTRTPRRQAVSTQMEPV